MNSANQVNSVTPRSFPALITEPSMTKAWNIVSHQGLFTPATAKYNQEMNRYQITTPAKYQAFDWTFELADLCPRVPFGTFGQRSAVINWTDSESVYRPGPPRADAKQPWLPKETAWKMFKEYEEKMTLFDNAFVTPKMTLKSLKDMERQPEKKQKFKVPRKARKVIKQQQEKSIENLLQEVREQYGEEPPRPVVTKITPDFAQRAEMKMKMSIAKAERARRMLKYTRIEQAMQVKEQRAWMNQYKRMANAQLKKTSPQEQKTPEQRRILKKKLLNRAIKDSKRSLKKERRPDDLDYQGVLDWVMPSSMTRATSDFSTAAKSVTSFFEMAKDSLAAFKDKASDVIVHLADRALVIVTQLNAMYEANFSSPSVVAGVYAIAAICGYSSKDLYAKLSTVLKDAFKHIFRLQDGVDAEPFDTLRDIVTYRLANFSLVKSLLGALGTLLVTFLGVVFGKTLNLKTPMSFASDFGRAAMGLKNMFAASKWIVNWIDDTYHESIYGMTREQRETLNSLPMFEQWAQNVNWIKEFTKEEIDTDAEVVEIILNTFQYGVILRKHVRAFNSSAVSRAFELLNNILLKQWMLAIQSKALKTGIRQVPASVYLYGKPGTGKSILSRILARDLLKKYYPKLAEKYNYSTLVYVRNAVQDHWDGFSSLSKICVQDDFAQKVDSVGCANPEYGETIQMINSCVFQPPMASIENKGNNPFECEHVIASSNVEVAKPKSIADAEALHRRRDHFFEVMIKEEYGKRVQRNGVDYYRVDEKKLPLTCTVHGGEYNRDEVCGVEDCEGRDVNCVSCKDVYVLQEYGIDGNRFEIKGKIGYAEFFRRYCESFEKKRQEHDVLKAENLQNLKTKEVRVDKRDPKTMHTFNLEMATEDDFLEMLNNMSLEELEEEHGMTTPEEIKNKLVTMRREEPMHEDITEEAVLSGNVDLTAEPQESPELERTVNAVEKRCSAMTKLVDSMRGLLPSKTACKIIVSVIVGGMFAYAAMRYRSEQNTCLVSSFENEDDFEKVDCRCAPCSSVEQVEEPMAKLLVLASVATDKIREKVYACIGKHVERETLKNPAYIAAYSGDARTVRPSRRSFVAYSGDARTVRPSRKNFVASAIETTSEDKNMLEEALTQEDIARLTLQDQNIEDMVWKLAKRNQVLLVGDMDEKFWKHHPEKGVSKCSRNGAIFIRGRTLITNHHFWSKLEANGYIAIHLKGSRRDTPYALITKKQCVSVRIVKPCGTPSDFVLVHCPTTVMEFANITKMFVRDEDLSRAFENCATISVLRSTSNDVGPVTHWLKTTGRVDPIEKIEVQGITSVGNIGYRFSTTAGDCGSPILTHANVPGRIIGMHFSGNGTYGVGVVISQAAIERGITELEKEIDKAALCDKTKSATLLKYPNFEIAIPEYIEQTVEAGPEFPNLVRIGKCKQPFTAVKTTVVKSAIHKKLEKPTTKPAYLKDTKNMNDEWVFPLDMGVKKFLTTKMAIPEHIAEQCKDDILDVTMKSYQGYEGEQEKPRVLTWKEMIQGSEVFGRLQPIERKTSPGYPYRINNVGEGKGKHPWFGYAENWILEGDKIDREVIAELDKFEKQAADGIVPEAIFMTQLKDERRPIEKVEAGKTRVFTIGNMAFNLLVRKYFGAFTSLQMTHRIENESAVGMNVFNAQDVSNLFRKITRFGRKQIVAGDYSNYDGSQPSTFHRLFADYVSDLYDDGARNRTIRRGLVEAMTNPMLLIDGYVYRATALNTSGNPVTVHINNFVNQMAVRMTYALGQINNGLPVKMRTFRDNVALQVFGDDNIMGVNEQISSWFNPWSITFLMRSFGFTYTDEAKTGVQSTTCRDVFECSFLKRTFTTDDDLITMRVGRRMLQDKGVIEESVKWAKGKMTPLEMLKQTNENCRTQLIEASAYGEEYFEKCRQKWKQAFKEIHADFTADMSWSRAINELESWDETEGSDWEQVRLQNLEFQMGDIWEEDEVPVDSSIVGGIYKDYVKPFCDDVVAFLAPPRTLYSILIEAEDNMTMALECELHDASDETLSEFAQNIWGMTTVIPVISQINIKMPPMIIDGYRVQEVYHAENIRFDINTEWAEVDEIRDMPEFTRTVEVREIKRTDWLWETLSIPGIIQKLYTKLLSLYNECREEWSTLSKKKTEPVKLYLMRIVHTFKAFLKGELTLKQTITVFFRVVKAGFGLLAAFTLPTAAIFSTIFFVLSEECIKRFASGAEGKEFVPFALAMQLSVLFACGVPTEENRAMTLICLLLAGVYAPFRMAAQALFGTEYETTRGWLNKLGGYGFGVAEFVAFMFGWLREGTESLLEIVALRIPPVFAHGRWNRLPMIQGCIEHLAWNMFAYCPVAWGVRKIVFFSECAWLLFDKHCPQWMNDDRTVRMILEELYRRWRPECDPASVASPPGNSV